MKKSTNIAALKELVNYNVLDRVKLRVNGVQAYNIADADEETVLVKKPWFFGHGGVDNDPVQSGLTWCALFPALDITSWLECNALAVLARLFPDMFRGPRPEFLRPCSILAKAVRNSL